MKGLSISEEDTVRICWSELRREIVVANELRGDLIDRSVELILA